MAGTLVEHSDDTPASKTWGTTLEIFKSATRLAALMDLIFGIRKSRLLFLIISSGQCSQLDEVAKQLEDCCYILRWGSAVKRLFSIKNNLPRVASELLDQLGKQDQLLAQHPSRL